MASSSILSNTPITAHTTTTPAVNSTKSTTTSSSSNSSHLTRKRSYESALTTSSANTPAATIEIDIAEGEQSKLMKPPASADELMSIKVDSSLNATNLKDFTRTISQQETDDIGVGGGATIAVDTASSPVKKKYAPPKTLQNLPSVSSGSSDIMVSLIQHFTYNYYIVSIRWQYSRGRFEFF